MLRCKSALCYTYLPSSFDVTAQGPKLVYMSHDIETYKGDYHFIHENITRNNRVIYRQVELLKYISSLLFLTGCLMAYKNLCSRLLICVLDLLNPSIKIWIAWFANTDAGADSGFLKKEVASKLRTDKTLAPGGVWGPQKQRKM